MVKAVAEFLIGAAVIVTPQYQIPLLIGSAALKIGTSLVRNGNECGEREEEIAHNGGKASPLLSRTHLGWARICLQQDVQ